MIEEIAERIVEMQIKNPKKFILTFFIITLMIVPGIISLVGNVEPSLEKVLPQDIEEVKTMNDMRAQFGADMIYIIVHSEDIVSDARDPKLLSYVDVLSEKIRTRDHITEVDNLADIVKESNNDVIPDSLDDVKEIIAINPFTPQFLSKDYGFTVIRIRSDTGASAAVVKEVIEGIKYDIESVESLNPGSRTEITGFNAIDKATFEVIMSDFAFITLVSMVLVSIVVLITFKSLVRGMMPMIVVMTAIIWTMGITGYLGLTITVVSMVAAAMIMGLGIDFGIHVVHGYFEMRKKNSIRKSMTSVMRELLRAMLGASLTTIAGFLALLFGILPAMKNLGIILALGILTTLIGAVFLLPAIIIIYDKNLYEGGR